MPAAYDISAQNSRTRLAQVNSLTKLTKFVAFGMEAVQKSLPATGCVYEGIL